SIRLAAPMRLNCWLRRIRNMQTSSPIDFDSATQSTSKQGRALQLVEGARKTLKVRHTVASTLTRQMQQMAISEMRGGRSAVQVGKIYNAAPIVVLELFFRAELDRMRNAEPATTRRAA